MKDRNSSNRPGALPTIPNVQHVAKLRLSKLVAEQKMASQVKEVDRLSCCRKMHTKVLHQESPNISWVCKLNIHFSKVSQAVPRKRNFNVTASKHPESKPRTCTVLSMFVYTHIYMHVYIYIYTRPPPHPPKIYAFVVPGA